MPQIDVIIAIRASFLSEFFMINEYRPTKKSKIAVCSILEAKMQSKVSIMYPRKFAFFANIYTVIHKVKAIG